jgi:hypothetical protein
MSVLFRNSYKQLFYNVMKMRLFLFLFLGLVHVTFAQKNVFKLYTDSVLLRNDSDLIIADFESRIAM